MGYLVVYTEEDGDGSISAEIMTKMGAGDIIAVVARILARTEKSMPAELRTQFRGDFLETLNQQRKEAGL